MFTDVLRSNTLILTRFMAKLDSNIFIWLLALILSSMSHWLLVMSFLSITHWSHRCHTHRYHRLAGSDTHFIRARLHLRVLWTPFVPLGHGKRRGGEPGLYSVI